MNYKLILFCLLSVIVLPLFAANEPEEPLPSVIVTDKAGEETTLSAGETFSGEAPISAVFTANAKEAENFTCVCEWRFTKSGETEPFLIRYENETSYTFDESGTTTVQLIVSYTQKDNSEIIYEYEFEKFTITISESSLKAPNAFSPNGDGINDYYNVYDVKSIVAFKGTIINRWGQKLFTWGLEEIDCEGCGWDGTYKGSPVKDGVYFVIIEAKGADGITYTFKKDVNILRGFTETGNSSNE